MSTLSLLPSITKRSKKRVGRGLGSGRGAKSGRGTTRHQGARENIPMSFEGGQGRLIKKFPLLRGKGKNASHQPLMRPISLALLNDFADDTVVTAQLLFDKNIINSVATAVKIVGTGALKKKLTVQLPVTQSAKKAIEELGGAVAAA